MSNLKGLNVGITLKDNIHSKKDNMWSEKESLGISVVTILGKIKKYPRCNPPVAHSTCCRSVTPSFSMAKELVNLQKNNTKSFISIFLIIMKIFTKLVSVFLLVAIGSLFSFHVLKKKNALQWFHSLKPLFSRQERTVWNWKRSYLIIKLIRRIV